MKKALNKKELIAKHFNKVQSFAQALNCFDAFNEYITKENIFITPDDLINFLDENPYFKKAVILIYEKYKEIILSGRIENITENSTLILAIKVFLYSNNIEIKNDLDKLDGENADITNSLKLYIKEINKIPLLTMEEEHLLGARLKNHDALARKKLIESNLRYVVKIAYKYLWTGLPLLDLIQEGNIGLMKAVDNFDYARNIRLTTYADLWISSTMQRAADNTYKLIRIPVHLEEWGRRYKRYSDELEKLLNREPTLEELAVKMNISPIKVLKIKKYLNDFEMIYSLDYKLEDEDTLLDTLPDEDIPLEERATRHLQKDEVERIFKRINLRERDKEIIKLCYGLTGLPPKSFSEIGKIYNLTRERIRQIHDNGLYRLRNIAEIKDFAIYMDNPEKSLELLEAQKACSKKPCVDSIYEEFADYNEFDINEILSCLSKSDRDIVYKRYNGFVLSDYEYDRFWRFIYISIKNRLKEKENRRVLKNN